MAKRRYKTAYNPLTGQKERVLKQGYYRDPFSGKIRKSNASHSAGHRTRPITKEEAKQRLQIFGIILAIALIYILIVWISSHLIETFLFLAVIVGAIILIIKNVPSVKEKFMTLLSKYHLSKPLVHDEKIRDLITAIEGIKIQDVRNEEDFEKQLFQRLDAKEYNVRRQVSFGSGKRVDLIVDENIGVERKVADWGKNIQDRIGQVTVYKKHLEKIIGGILDYGNVTDMEEYINLIRAIDKENVYVVVVKGNVRRYKKKEEYVMVKKTTSRY